MASDEKHNNLENTFYLHELAAGSSHLVYFSLNDKGGGGELND